MSAVTKLYAIQGEIHKAKLQNYEKTKLIKDLATTSFREEPWECEKREGRRGKCACFDCQPMTMEEACIRYLAGERVEFKYIG